MIIALILLIPCISSNSFSQSFKSLSNNEKIECLPEVQVTQTMSNSKLPDLATDSKGNVHIVWDDERKERLVTEKQNPEQACSKGTMKKNNWSLGHDY